MRLSPAHRAFAFEPAQPNQSNVNNVGVLCIHGFTGSPNDMRPLGEALARQGYSAYAPVLPGHGGLPHKIKGYGWHDWVEAARDALRKLCKTHAHVFIAGLSMGGLITLHLAASEHQCAMPEGRVLPIRGIVVLAAPSAINDRRVKLVRFARHVVPWHYPLKGADFRDEAVRADILKRADGRAINFDDRRVQSRL